MPDKGHLQGRGEFGRQIHDERQRYPGFGSLPPRQPVTGGAPCEPSNPIAAAILAVLRDPCARVEMQLALEESLRNFQQHVRKPSWIEPPFDAMRSRNIIDTTGDHAITVPGGWQDVITGDVLNGEIAVLRGFGQGVTSAGYWDTLRWRFAERGLGKAEQDASEYGITPYLDIRHQLGQLDIMTDVYAIITGPKTWAVQANHNLGGLTVTATARIQGWKWSTRAPGDSVGGTIVD